MDPYSLKAIGDRKIADDREWAARYQLAVEADRGRREGRQLAGSLLAGLLRTLASALAFQPPGGARDSPRTAG